MKNLKLIVTIFLASFSILSQAQTIIPSGTMVSTGMNVGASISSVCNLQASNISLGNYNPTTSTGINTSVNISIICTKDTSASLKIDAGKYSDGTNRYMINTNGVDKLKYTLMDGNTYTFISLDTSYSSIVGNGVQQNAPLIASIPPQQNVSASNYSDTIVFSIEY